MFLRLLTVLIVAISIHHSPAEDRLWVDVKINGQPLRFVFDTGATHTFLFKKSAQRLGLKWTNAPTDMPLSVGSMPFGVTEECKFTLGTNSVRGKIAVTDFPNYLPVNFDGLMAWESLHENIIEIDALAGRLRFLERVPLEATRWHALHLIEDAKTLTFEIPRGNATNILEVDTGDSEGVGFPPDAWKAWRKSNARQPITLVSSFMPGVGVHVREVAWARDVLIGRLQISDVPVIEASLPHYASLGSRLEAVLGYAALKRVRLIIDGPKKRAYVSARTEPAGPYNHNRLGAVFIPKNAESDDLVARVAEGSPAHDAGIRNGDLLLKVDSIDATKWKTDPNVLPLSRFWHRPSGTVLHLAIRHEDRIMETNVVLKDLVGPGRAFR